MLRELITQVTFYPGSVPPFERNAHSRHHATGLTDPLSYVEQ